MLNATNIVKAKLINIWVVFEAIRIRGPIARTDIADATGLSKQATSDLVDELLSYGFIRQQRAEGKRVGKPPMPLSINPDGAFTIGLHVDFGQLNSVVMNLAGEIVTSESIALRQLEPPEAARDIGAVARMLYEKIGDPGRFLGVGLATPGPFGVPGLSPPRLPGWDGAVLTSLLRETTRLPVMLANDGQCAVTAEWRFGEIARRLTNFVYVYLGMGLGSGVMIQSAAFGGARGNAGEFGHVTAVPGGHACICGKRGCLETYVSVDSAMRHLAAHGVEVGSMREFAAAFKPDDPLVAAWIEVGTEPLRTGLNTLENLFDPQTIMMGGNAPDWLIDAFLQRVQPLHPSIGRAEPEIPRLMKAQLGADAVARGAAVMPVLATLNPQFQQLNAAP